MTPIAPPLKARSVFHRAFTVDFDAFEFDAENDLCSDGFTYEDANELVETLSRLC